MEYNELSRIKQFDTLLGSTKKAARLMPRLAAPIGRCCDQVLSYQARGQWMALLAHALYGPLLLAQRAPVVLLDPKRHAAEVEAVVALAPHDHAVLLAVRVLLVALALAAQARVCGRRRTLLETIGTPENYTFSLKLHPGHLMANRQLFLFNKRQTDIFLFHGRTSLMRTLGTLRTAL